MISAIILAAGESKRMGRPKQLLSLGNQTVIQRVVDNFVNSKVDEVIVVLGFCWKEIEFSIQNKPIKTVLNKAYSNGMSSSIRKGLSSLSRESDAFFIALGDQPLIKKDLINMLIEKFENSKKGIIVPVFKGRRGHPVLFSSRYKKDFNILKGDEGGKRILYSNNEDILEAEVETETVLFDMDEKKDYEYIKSLFINKPA
ncbi:MAG: nucleotidyltransferase family protein [Thermodesulfobacteriota bacterium]|nr:nucleotidyltransferase family protein [Thermodesulfobacteriota bacterium]